jgi:NADPH:quinone reductase-like Zn-dependent oxidoreductase
MKSPFLRFVRVVSISLLVALLTFTGDVTSLSAQSLGEGRAILVTGASSGIGLSMTEVLSANGFHVYAGARSVDDLQRLDAMENVSSDRIDVTVQQEIDAAVELIRMLDDALSGGR